MRRLTLLCAVVWLLLWPGVGRAAAQTAAPFPRFGVIEAYEAPDAAADLGVGWTRVRIHWGETQPDGPDQWVETRVGAREIAAERAAGRQILGLLIGIPDWARDVDLLPKGLWLPPDHPDNTWAVFVRQAVGRYAGQIDHWVIWNEPDIWQKSAPGHTWDGDELAFAQLLRVGYLTAKQANPRAVIHLPALTFFWDNNFGRPQYLDRLLAALAQDPAAAEHGFYFDIATAHLYFQPNQIFDILTIWRQSMARYGLGDKPWWLVETNAPVSDDPTWPVESVTLAVSQVDQAQYMPQAIAVALAAGVDHISVFKLIDTASDRLANPEPFGLVRADGSRRPAFATYREAIVRLGDTAEAVRERWDAVGQIRLSHADGALTHVLFARVAAPQQATVLARGETAQLIDAFGNARPLTAVDGRFQIDLPAAPCTHPIADHCLIGGPTYYLVQPPVAAVDAVVTSNQAAVNFPNDVAFELQYRSERPLRAARLTFDVEQTSCVPAVTVVPVEPETPGVLSWRWVMVRSGNPPPGATLWWEWTLTDADGRTLVTPRQTIALEDTRFDWRTVAGERIRLNWYRGDAVGPLLLQAAETALGRLENEMGILLEGGATFYIYGNAAAMRDAVLYRNDWAGGVAFADYNTILIGVEPSQAADWGVRVVAHELAHLVLGQFGRSCLGGSRPTWLEEGLAQAAEGATAAETARALRRAIADNALIPLRSLNGAFPAHDSGALLAYAQSESVVRYLLERDGPQAMQALVLTLADATPLDAALQATHGLTVDELELAWRAAVGAPPRVIPPTPTPPLAAAVPTIPPVAAGSAVPTPVAPPVAPTAEPAGPLAGLRALCGLGTAVPLLLTAALIWRRRRIP